MKSSNEGSNGEVTVITLLSIIKIIFDFTFVLTEQVQVALLQDIQAN